MWARVSVFSAVLMIGQSRISSIERWQPMQQSVASSIWHTAMQGEGIELSMTGARRARRRARRASRSEGGGWLKRASPSLRAAF
jgi:hypothetical protein